MMTNRGNAPAGYDHAAAMQRAAQQKGKTPKQEQQERTAKRAAAVMRIYKDARDVMDRVAIAALRDARNEVDPSEAGIAKTLAAAETMRGAGIAPQFNNAEDRARLIRVLDRIARGQYEFRRVEVSRGVVPGFTFGGMPVRGTIYEWRLFNTRHNPGTVRGL